MKLNQFCKFIFIAAFVFTFLLLRLGNDFSAHDEVHPHLEMADTVGDCLDDDAGHLHLDCTATQFVHHPAAVQSFPLYLPHHTAAALALPTSLSTRPPPIA